MLKKSLLLFSLIFASSSFADSGGDIDGDTLRSLSSSSELSLRSDYSYTFESDFDDGSLGALSVNRFNASARVPLNLSENLRLQTGVSYRRLDFESDSALVPDQMQGLAAILGLEYLVKDQPVAGLRAAPGFYFIDDIESDSFDVPTILYAGWRVTPKFIALGGASYSSLRDDNKVVPLAGFIWTVNDDLKFNALFPVASIDYQMDDRLAVSLIGEYVGLRAHTGNSLADSDYHDAAVKYSEVRAGLRVRYSLTDSTSLDLSGGWTFRQEFEFDEPDESYRTGGAPFVGVSVRKSF